ncbi:OLC1v1017137C5 [Oldenlandia corymbosa var. corymbosa]|nr:OLC1v1017137C5 [Oldenlandia corymbosa var. corymbosa]
MAAPPREQALSLLASANNHGDLAVKLSSLKQAKDILLAAEPYQAAELFPYLVELQSSPESLVRKALLDAIEDLGLRALEQFSIFVPVLLKLLNDESPMVARQSIVTGTSIFSRVLEELALQFHQRGNIDMWLEELWRWMSKFKDAVIDTLFEAAPLAVKLLTVKFIEMNVLLFTSDRSDSELSSAEAISRHRAFNISWVAGHHPVLNKAELTSDANRSLGIMLDLLQSASNLPGLLTISIINSLATIARRRPTLYNPILLALLKFDSNFEMAKGGHLASIQYSIRTAFLGFLRCTHPTALESRERLMKALRVMNAGDAADQVLRQVEKSMRMNERASRDTRLSKDEQMLDYHSNSVDQGRKRSQPSDSEDPSNNSDTAYKRVRYGPNTHATPPMDKNDTEQEYINGMSAKGSSIDSNLTTVEQMIAMIGALIAEGERGVQSLELLVSDMHPDLLADIVITNMRHLPKNPPSLARPTTSTHSNTSDLVQNVASTVSTSPEIISHGPVSPLNVSGSPVFDMSASNNLSSDSKRDQRRDPRRLDPRRSVAAVGLPPPPPAENITNASQTAEMQYHVDSPSSLVKPPSPPGVPSSDSLLVPLTPKTEVGLTSPECAPASQSATPVEVRVEALQETKGALDPSFHPGESVQDSAAQTSQGFLSTDVYSPSSLETDEISPDVSDMECTEASNAELPALPAYIDLNEGKQSSLQTLAFRRIFDSYDNLRDPGSKEMRMALLARLVAKIDAGDDAITEMQRHLAFRYHHEEGHELVVYVLFHLHSLMLSGSEGNSTLFAAMYENFLLGMAKSLLDILPSTDKSFSQLLREVPFLTKAIMRLLDDLCCDKYIGTDTGDGDRVTQGLGALWSLIASRPLNRQGCLDIALKCAVHPKENVRVKAINLVAKKLYKVGYISENIEQFAMKMFLSVVDQRAPDIEPSQSETIEQKTKRETGSHETSVSGSQVSETGLSENDSTKGAEIDVLQHASLFFALITQKPSLLRILFENYERSPKAVQQDMHRQIPLLTRALRPCYSDLLQIISDPPPGSESLLAQMLHILSEGTTPPPNLVHTVKHLYETKLKDPSILIPILSSFSKNEVLPIFPQLVNLPLDKFQTALAHILQGSAHSGPALTPAEVMVAIHDINPDRDHLPLKKITDACSVCFEQRTVFTQQVMARALRQMVDRTPLPLLFMRTVIQTTDAFPALVDFVMELLSKLVSRQVWRMPKLWVGFLKCVSQTQPHSFPVLLQLPSPQLESALSKYPHLRGPLANYAGQPSVRNSLSR